MKTLFRHGWLWITVCSSGKHNITICAFLFDIINIKMSSSSRNFISSPFLRKKNSDPPSSSLLIRQTPSHLSPPNPDYLGGGGVNSSSSIITTPNERRKRFAFLHAMSLHAGSSSTAPDGQGPSGSGVSGGGTTKPPAPMRAQSYGGGSMNDITSNSIMNSVVDPQNQQQSRQTPVQQQSTDQMAPPSVLALQLKRRAAAASETASSRLPTLENHPHYTSFKRIETVLERMVYEDDRVPVRNVKTLLTTTPSVFRGIDLVTWLVDHLKVDRMQALHFAHLMAVHGYVFPIDDHCLTVKNDNSLYRFQTPCLWLSNCLEPDDSEYAIYLCKRTLTDKQRLQLLDYETEALDRLQRQLARKWDSICIQAEAQYRVDRKRPKSQQKILDGQERAFWDVFQPVPGCVKPMELDYRKSFRLVRIQSHAKTKEMVEEERKAKLIEEIIIIRKTLERTRSKVSKTFENLKSFTLMYSDYDGFVGKVEPSNPWVTDSSDFWEAEKANTSAGNLSGRRVRRWAFNIHELLRDPAGVDQFSRFLEKEFSAENLRFYRACRELSLLPIRDVAKRVQEIFDEHLAPGCSDPVNIDSRVADLVRSRLANAQLDRYTFDEAEDQIYNLMKNDSYNRFIRSEFYRELPAAKKKASIMDAVRGMILQLAPATSSNASTNNIAASSGVLLTAQAPLQTCTSSPALNAALQLQATTTGSSSNINNSNNLPATLPSGGTSTESLQPLSSQKI